MMMLLQIMSSLQTSPVGHMAGPATHPLTLVTGDDDATAHGGATATALAARRQHGGNFISL